VKRNVWKQVSILPEQKLLFRRAVYWIIETVNYLRRNMSAVEHCFPMIIQTAVVLTLWSYNGKRMRKLLAMDTDGNGYRWQWLVKQVNLFLCLTISGLENREYGRRDPPRWPRGTLYLKKLALTSPTSRGLSGGIVSSRTQATESSLSWTN
jgi:hypothetical protein